MKIFWTIMVFFIFAFHFSNIKIWAQDTEKNEAKTVMTDDVPGVLDDENALEAAAVMEEENLNTVDEIAVPADVQVVKKEPTPMSLKTKAVSAVSDAEEKALPKVDAEKETKKAESAPAEPSRY